MWSLLLRSHFLSGHYSFYFIFLFFNWIVVLQRCAGFCRTTTCCCCSCCCCCVASVVSDCVRPHRWQPTRLPGPWDSPGKNTGVACHFLLQCMKVKSESEVAQSCPTLATPWTADHQATPSMGFSRQEYWSGLPLPSPTTTWISHNSIHKASLLSLPSPIPPF